MTQEQTTASQNGAFNEASDDGAFKSEDITRALIWIGVAGLGAALAFTLIRSMTSRRESDPTADRIQDLIDEANRLLKSLDAKHAG